MAKSFSFSFFLFTREGKRKAKPRSWAEVNGQSKAGMNQKKALNHLFCTSRQCFEEEEEEEGSRQDAPHLVVVALLAAVTHIEYSFRFEWKSPCVRRRYLPVM